MGFIARDFVTSLYTHALFAHIVFSLHCSWEYSEQMYRVHSNTTVIDNFMSLYFNVYTHTWSYLAMHWTGQVLCRSNFFNTFVEDISLWTFSWNETKSVCWLWVLHVIHMLANLGPIASKSEVIMAVLSLILHGESPPTIWIMLAISFVVHACGQWISGEWLVCWQFYLFGLSFYILGS